MLYLSVFMLSHPRLLSMVMLMLLRVCYFVVVVVVVGPVVDVVDGVSQ